MSLERKRAIIKRKREDEKEERACNPLATEISVAGRERIVRRDEK